MTEPEEGNLHRSGAFPRARLVGAVDVPVQDVDCLVKANLAGVALGDRVSRDDADPALASDRQISKQEVRAQVGAAALTTADVVDQVLADVLAKAAGECLTAHERRVA